MRFDEIRRGLSTVRPRNVLEIGAGQGGLGAWIALAAPFRVLQLPFARTDSGIGYVVLARRTS